MPSDLEDFCNRWLGKADNYRAPSIQDIFDQFWSLFVAYNAIYNYISRILLKRGAIQPKDTGDRHCATKHIPFFIGYDRLAKKLRNQQDEIDAIFGLIENGTFYIHSNTINNLPNFQKDKTVIGQIRNGDDKDYCEGILKLIYQIRCNMFHGSKQYDPIQGSLLSPVNKLLRSVIEESLIALH